VISQPSLKRLDMHFKQVTFDITQPASAVTALQKALRYHPNFVSMCCEPEAVWSSVLPAYKRAGVTIVGTGVSPATVGKTLVANFPSPSQSEQMGSTLADWLTVNSDGKANVLFEGVPEELEVGLYEKGLSSEFTNVCPKCHLTTLDVTLQQLEGGTSQQAVVMALRSDPSAQYVAISNGSDADGLRADLDNAGLSKVKIVGFNPDPTAFDEMKTGTQSAWVSQTIPFQAFIGIDVLLRASEHMAIPSYDGVVPTLLFDQQNSRKLTTYEENDQGLPDYNFAAAFYKLWHVR
jgi:ABC-type sugar transport system substrate-binding protein